MNNIHNFCVVALMFLSLQGTGLCKDQKNVDTSFSSLGDFFDEFDRLFAQTAGAIDASRARISTVVAKQAEDTLQKIREQSRQMHKAATESLRSLNQATSETFSHVLEQAHEAMKKGVDSFGDLVGQMEQDVSQTKNFSQFEVRELGQADTDSYGLKIMLPGCNKNDIQVSINKHEDKRLGGIQKTLEVQAHQARRQTKQIENVQIQRSEQMRSSSIINGRKCSIDYKNGDVVVIADLPIDIDDENYTMTFEDECLVLEFTRTGKKDQRKSLMFTNEK